MKVTVLRTNPCLNIAAFNIPPVDLFEKLSKPFEIFIPYEELTDRTHLRRYCRVARTPFGTGISQLSNTSRGACRFVGDHFKQRPVKAISQLVKQCALLTRTTVHNIGVIRVTSDWQNG